MGETEKHVRDYNSDHFWSSTVKTFFFFIRSCFIKSTSFQVLPDTAHFLTPRLDQRQRLELTGQQHFLQLPIG